MKYQQFIVQDMYELNKSGSRTCIRQVCFKDENGNLKDSNYEIFLRYSLDGAIYKLQARHWGDGTLIKIKDGFIHCENGPAITTSYGSKEYWLNGHYVSPEEVFDQLNDEQKEEAIWNLDQWT